MVRKAFLFAVLLPLFVFQPANGEVMDFEPQGYTFVSKFIVKPSAQDKFIAFMRKAGAAIVAKKGVKEWRIFRDDEDDTVFIVWEIYEDYASYLNKHKVPPQIEGAEILGEVLAGSVEVRKLKSLASPVP